MKTTVRSVVCVSAMLAVLALGGCQSLPFVEGAMVDEEDEDALEAVEQLQEDCPVEEGAVPWDEDERLSLQEADVSSCETNLENRRADLDEVSTTTTQTSRYESARDYLSELDNRIAEWDETIEQKYAERGADRERSNEWSDFFDRDEQRVVRNMHEDMIFADEPDVEYAGFQIEDTIEVASAFPEKEERCQEYFDIDRDWSSYDEDEAMHPSNACDLAYNFEDHMTRYLGYNIQSEAESVTEDLEETLDDIRRNGMVSEEEKAKMTDPEAAKADLAERYEGYFEDELGIDFNESLLDDIDAFEGLDEQFEDAVAEAQQEQRLDPADYNEEPAVESAIERVADEEMDRFEFVTYGVAGSDWRVEHKADGTPDYRVHDGRVAFQVEGEDYCRVYDFHATADYAGGGDYQDPRLDLNRGQPTYALTEDTTYRISACP